MRIEDGGSFGQTTVMQPDITLSLVIDGKVARAPLKFTFAELEQRMVVDFQCAANRIRAIFKRVEEYGSCRSWERRNVSREQHKCLCRIYKLLSAFGHVTARRCRNADGG